MLRKKLKELIIDYDSRFLDGYWWGRLEEWRRPLWYCSKCVAHIFLVLWNMLLL